MDPAPVLLSTLLRRTLQQHYCYQQVRGTLLAATLLLLSIGASAQRTSDKTAMEDERRILQIELQQIQQAYDAVKGQSKNNLHQLAALNKKIEIQERYINNIGKEIKLIDDDIYYSAIEIKRLKKQMDTLKFHYAKTVVYAYKNRSNYDYLNFIFSANSFNDAVKRVAYLKSYRSYRGKQMDDIAKTSRLIDVRYSQQLVSKQKKQNVLETRTDQYNILENQITEKDSVAKLLQYQAGTLQKQIAKKQQEDKQLKTDIAAVVRKEIAEAKKIAQEEARQRALAEAKARRDAWEKQRLQETQQALTTAKAIPSNATTGVAAEKTSTSESTPAIAVRKPKFDPVGIEKRIEIKEVPKSGNTIVAHAQPLAVKKTPPPIEPPTVLENKAPEGGYLNYKADDIALNSDFSKNRRGLPAPVDGVITLGFGRYKIEGVGPDVVGDNPGVTYTAQVGAPVRAVFNGEVVSVSKVGATSFVVLRHGKYFTAYSNLASVNVSKGATVSRGQTIGSVGADEEAGGGKLDFILMIEERNVDPRAWLR